MGEFAEFSMLLREILEPFGKLSEQQLTLLYGHYCLLRRWSQVLNLTAVTEMPEAVLRHYCESLFLGWRLPAGELRIVDLGSGAGFPGIPIAVVRRDCYMVLAEARHRKAAFLREATRDWGNVQVHFGRAEELEGRFDWVVARAVRPDLAVRAAGRLADRVGLLVALVEKGRAWEQDAAGWQRKAGVAVRWGSPIRLPWGERRAVLIGELVRP